MRNQSGLSASDRGRRANRLGQMLTSLGHVWCSVYEYRKRPTRVQLEDSMIKIIADSTCNLPPDLIQQHDIRIAPIAIQFGMETYEEGIDIDRDAFYAKIEEMGIIPTSSQPPPGVFVDHYRELSAQGHQVLVITVTRKHSGTHNSAMLAKDLVPEAGVVVFDSAMISLGTGYMVLEAARMAEAGASMDEVLARLGHIRAHATLFFTPATLRYLQMSGRVGGLKAALASILDLKPIIGTVDGQLDVCQNVRSRSGSIARLIELTERAHGTQTPLNIAIIHARAPQVAETLLARVKSHFPCRGTMVEDLVASLAVHGGPGIVGIGAYPA